MIEKLSEYEITSRDSGAFINVECNTKIINTLVRKLNEIIDTIYDMQLAISNLDPDSDWYDGDHIADISKKVDPYAEQRKWIGKLCKFWDDDAFITSKDWAFGMLTSIDKGMQYQYCCNENCNFKHCEPVKPDDNIIYKGEDNE